MVESNGAAGPPSWERRRSILPLFANQGSLGRMVRAGSDDEDDGTSEEPRMRLEWNTGQDSNIGSSTVVHIHTTRSCVGRVSSLFDRLGLSQRFADRAMEEKFRHEYWKAAFFPILAAVGSGLFWGAARYGMGMYGQSVGWDRYHECCSQYIRYGRGSEDNQMKMILYEALWPGVWFILLIGRRIDANLLATFLARLIPEPVRRRFSRGRNILHIWNDDGSLKISALGEFYGWVGALGVIPIAASPYMGWASTSVIADGSQEQFPWVLVTFMIMLRYLTHHAVFFFWASTLCVWVGFTIRHTVLAVGGGSLFFVYEMVSLLVCAVIGAMAVACVYQHESSTRASFLQVRVEDSVQKLLFTVLHKILPDRAVDQIADCARANAPLVASAETFLDTAVIFIRVNLEEAVSSSAKQKMRELNRVYGKIDKIVELDQNVYKVETVGPEYLCCVGVPEACESPSCVAIAFCIQVERAVSQLKWESGAQVQLKVGIHSGRLTAGISGTVSPQFRLFGDTVNTASRMKSQAAPGEIILSDTTVDKVKMCCGVEVGEDGRIRCSGPAAVLTSIGVRSVKGLGSMRLWSATDGTGENMQSNPEAHLTCRATGGESVSHNFSAVTASSMQDSAGLSFKPFEEWMSFSRGLGEKDYVGDMQYFEDLLDMLPQISKLDMQPSLMFRFKNAKVEAAYRIWLNRTMVKSRNFFIFSSVLYAVFMVLIAHSHATFSLEPVASSTEWMAFTVVSMLFLCTLPLALAIAAYLSIYASVKIKERYAWAQSWIFAYVVLGYMVWLLGPSMYFPVVLSKHARERGTSRTMPLQNFFDISIYSSALFKNSQLSEWAAVGSMPQLFKDVRPYLGNFDSCYFLFALIQLTFHARIDFTCFFVALYIVFIALEVVLGGGQFTKTESLICLSLIFLEMVYLSVAKRREFRSIILASRTRKFVGLIVQNLLPDHIFKALLKGEMETVADEFTCGHFFLDLKGFTHLSASLTPEESFEFISSLFSSFDSICQKWGATKIETIGDAYWCASGLPGTVQSDDNLSMVRLLGMAVEIQKVLRERSLPCFSVAAIKAKDHCVEARVAIHYGKCTGGVVGSSRPRYHLFGSAIEIVQVLEEEGSINGVVLSNSAAKAMGLAKNGICDDVHLLSVLKNVESSLLSGSCLVMENYRISQRGVSSIQDALDVEATGSSFIARNHTEEKETGRKTCWDEGVGSNSVLPAFVISMRQTDLPASVGSNVAGVVL